jgi:hypothetical protein
MNLVIKRIFFGLIFIIVFVFLPFYLKTWKDKKKNDRKYNISLIIQTGPQKEALRSLYLEELLGLSIDKPTNIYLFDEKEAKRKLLLSPVIEKAVVKKIKPSAIYIDYKVREPVALLYDLKNVAIDKKGNIFPVSPFFTPKNLPEIYLGDSSFLEEMDFWQKPLLTENVLLALKLLKILTTQEIPFNIKRIDVSNIFASYGKREIVVILEHTLNVSQNEKEVALVFPRIIRLSLKDYQQQLGNYFILHNKMACDYKKQIVIKKETPSIIRFASKTIDLRISKLAFIDQ